MAEFLVKAQRHWSYKEDMTVEEQAEYDKQYQIGDIVQVFPDGKLQDAAHAGGKFYLIRVFGLDFDKALKYQKDWNEDGLRIKRRIYRIRAEDLPTAVKIQLRDTYVYNTTWDKVRSYIRNNITNLDE